jgi:predicted RNA-binding protein YlxR (DUF448 family)
MVQAQLNPMQNKRGRSTKSERTCVACGRKDAPEEFARLVCAPDGELVVDWRRNLAGRGSHVCVSRACVETVVKKRLLGRVFKREVQYPKQTDLLNTMRSTLERQLETLIGSGIGARFVVIGTDLTYQALKAEKLYCITVAADSTSCERLCKLAITQKVPVAMVDTKKTLGLFASRGETGAMAVKNRGLARAILLISSRIRALD